MKSDLSLAAAAMEGSAGMSTAVIVLTIVLPQATSPDQSDLVHLEASRGRVRI
jgi:hypothetical protein